MAGKAVKAVHLLTVITDANATMGIGHGMRCLAIAEAFIANGWQVTLETSDMLASIRQKYQNRGIDIHDRKDANQADQIVGRATSSNSDLFLVDGYHFNAEFRRRLSELPGAVMTLDDHGDPINFIADVVVNPWHYAEKINLPATSSTKLLAGPHFFPFRRTILQAATVPNLPFSERRRILLTLGGADPSSLTAAILSDASEKMPDDSELDVVVGPANPHLEAICQTIEASIRPIHLHIAPEHLPLLMRQAGLAISAGGGTSAELAHLGTPLLMVLIADNQDINGANAWCPVVDGRQKLAATAIWDTTVELWRDLDQRKAIAVAGLEHYNSDGAQLIFDAVIAR